MTLLRECGTTKLLRECGTAKLLRACPPSIDVCGELPSNPNLALKFTWSGTLNRCTDCWYSDEDNPYQDIGHYQCTAAPTTLPNFSALNCQWEIIDLASQLRIDFYPNFCGEDQGPMPIFKVCPVAVCVWNCTDGFFELEVIGAYHGVPMFYFGGYNVKSGDVLPNQLSCLSVIGEVCANPAYLPWPAFTTGGSYKVEIA
jgi:hypothetical protein